MFIAILSSAVLLIYLLLFWFTRLAQTHGPYHRDYSKDTRIQKCLDTMHRKVGVRSGVPDLGYMYP